MSSDNTKLEFGFLENWMSIALKIEISYQLIIDVVGMCGKSW